MRADLIVAAMLVGTGSTLTGCGLEAVLGDGVSGGSFVEYVPAPEEPQTLRVRVSDRPGEAVVLGEVSAIASPIGWAALTVPFDTDLRFAVVRSGPLAALVPPGATAIAMDDRSTADVRLLEALGSDLGAASGVALMALLNEVRTQGRGANYYWQVTRELLGLPNSAAKELADLAMGRAITPCVDQERIRVVFQVEMRDGMRDGNCVPLDRFAWATDVAAASMFITGDVHEDYVGADPADALSAHEAMAGFAPNILPMQDVGDGVWRFVVDLPRAQPPLQLGYKYTWGLKGSTWTGTEEWPGNQRLLEVVDVDGDGLVVVLDRFGDEASNKDKQNLRRGGLGFIDYTSDADGDGWLDAQEHPIAAPGAGDCAPDGFPEAEGVKPLLADCADPAPPAAPQDGGGPVVVDEVKVAGRIGNGGGDVVTVRGSGFVGRVEVLFAGKPAAAVLVRSPTELVAATPRLAKGKAVVEVGGVIGSEIDVDGPGRGSGSSDSPCRLHDAGGLPTEGHFIMSNGSGTNVTILGRTTSEEIAWMELGLGPADTDPESDESWTFWPARYVGRTVSAGVTEGEYAAELPIPSPGNWSFGFRLSGDSGRTWRYCEGFGSFDVVEEG